MPSPVRLGIALSLAWNCLPVPDLHAAPARTDATVLEVSRIPDPLASVYPDCLFTAKVSPQWQGTNLAPVILVLRAYMDRALTPQASLAPGDRIRVEAIPFADMEPEYRSLRMADTLSDLELNVWAGLSVDLITEGERPAEWPAAWALPGIDPAPALVSAVVSAPARTRRAQAIRTDRERIQALLKQHRGWEEWYQACGPYRDRIRSLPGPGPHRVKGRSVLIDPAGAMDYRLSDDAAAYRNVLRALEEMTRQFRQAGTDLIIVPIPRRDEVYAASFAGTLPADGVLQPYRLKFFHDLLSRDIEAVDLLPAFRELLSGGGVPYHDTTLDGHVSGEAARLTGEVLAPRLRRYAFEHAPVDYAVTPVTYVCEGDLVLFRPEQTYQAFRVYEPDWSAIARDAERSEVLVIGDSMVTAPTQLFGANVGLHLMRSAGIPFSFFKRAGAASQMARFLTREGSARLFSSRKVCIFIFAFDYVIRPEETWAVAPFVERWIKADEPDPEPVPPADP